MSAKKAAELQSQVDDLCTELEEVKEDRDHWKSQMGDAEVQLKEASRYRKERDVAQQKAEQLAEEIETLRSKLQDGGELYEIQLRESQDEVKHLQHELASKELQKFQALEVERSKWEEKCEEEAKQWRGREQRWLSREEQLEEELKQLRARPIGTTPLEDGTREKLSSST